MKKLKVSMYKLGDSIQYIKKLPGKLFALAGSFIIAAGWSWYHFYRQPRWLFGLKFIAVAFLVYILFIILKKLYLFIVNRSGRHFFWRNGFYYNLDKFFFFSSLIFLIFFIKIEIISLIYCLLLFPALFVIVQKSLLLHPGGKPWITMNRWIFFFIYFIFCLESTLQYLAYHYYILDNNIRYFNIVLFRSFAMTLFWVFGFVIANYWYQRFRGAWRYLLVSLWILIFSFFLAVWTINIGILYYSGLYFSPVVLSHIVGSGGVVNNPLSYLLAAGSIVVLAAFIYLVKNNLRVHRSFGLKYSSFYNYSLGVLALVALLTLSSFRNTPEHSIVQSFIKYYFGETTEPVLDIKLQRKLSKFGLIYDTNQFYLISRNEVFTPTSTKLLPERLQTTKPNILIIELESFSSRLTGPYGTKFSGLTPGLDDFASDKNTTIFEKYFNASTPTITGTLSQFCSFLPPTGHNEIQNERKLQSHRLLCLPEILKKQAGYKYAAYVTAVDKNYANKNGIFTGMGMDKVFGTAELKPYIKGKPLSWGYSDHQLFPAVLEFMKNAEQPFLYVLATVDTHPPFDLAKDPVNYGDGSEPVLNMFHTTDDAFRKFWIEFKNSEFYKNTIVIAVADHAIFPGAITKDLFKTEAKSLTYYDENFFGIYIPDSVLPRRISVYSSGIDFAPTILQLLDINIFNSFEGYSIFSDRIKYPNLLGMHELGLYINQITENGKRKIDYNIPSEINCNLESTENDSLTLCDFLEFYKWKREMFEDGRFWKHEKI